ALECMFLPDYVERYGLDHYETALNTLHDLTHFTSSEFAIRPFIVKYPQTISAMYQWSNHSDEHVRRLANEGCRPRLPWAMALPDLKHDPSPILPLLENLQRDPSEYVRRSVANNLNDISKDHPDLILAIAKRWLGQSAATDKLVKHACRTLLKAGNAQAMQLFGYCNPDLVQTTDYQLDKSILNLGDRIECRFKLENTSEEAAMIRLEYGVYFLLKNGNLSRKVFKISEKKYAPNSSAEVTKSIHFKPISTRTFYAGKHEISIIINGVEKVKARFELQL
ncbi:MAG: DNA alkylation repair protein, partial [Saprospiraceae bacterium]